MDTRIEKKKWKFYIITIIIFIVIFIISFGIMFFLVSFTNKKSIVEKDYIYWSFNRNLKISDFILVDSISNNISASSCTGIIMIIVDSVPYGYQAIAIFDKSKSEWNRNTKDSVKILKHEQLHFDITQYITQELNKEMRYCMCPRESTKMYYQYLIKLDSMQKLYDYETNHSRNISSQNEWDIKMISLLYKDLALVK